MSRGRASGPGKLSKKGRNWVLAWRDEHHKHRRRVLATDKKTAERIRSDIINRRDLALAGLGSEAGQSASLREIVDDYLIDLEARSTPRHFAQVRSRLEKILRALGDLRVRDLRPMQMVRLRNEELQKGRSHRTANLIVTTLQSVLKWAVENELIAHSRIANVKKLPEGEGYQEYDRRSLSDHEIERFLEVSEADDEENDIAAGLQGITRIPQTPLWFTLIHLGPRYGETTLATWGDINLGERPTLTLCAKNTKSRRRRVVPLMPELVDRLRELKVLHENVLGRLPTVSDRIFLSPEGANMPWHTANAMRIFDRLIKRAGIPKIDAQGQKIDIHALRHTCASLLARRNVSPLKVQLLLGQSDASLTTRVYTHLDAEDLRAALEPSDNGPKPDYGRTAQDQS